MSNRGFYFGFGSVAIFENKVLRGAAHITGAMSAEIMSQASKLMGGGTSYPVDQRHARSEGNLTLTLNERQPWIDEIFNEGTKTDTAAASASVGTIENVSGSTLAAKLTIAVKSGSEPVPGYYEAEQSGPAALTFTYFGPTGGVREIDVTGVGTTAKDIGSTGLTVLASSASPAFTSGAKVRFEVTPAHGGLSTIKIPQHHRGKSYEVRAWSALGSNDGNIENIIIPKVQFLGVNWTFTDNEYGSSGVEATGTILAPDDGTAIFERRSYAPTS